MDDASKRDLILPEHPILTKSVPHAILEDFSQELYCISWEPANSGVVTGTPRLVHKQELAEHFPHVVAAWEAKQHATREDAEQRDRYVVAFAGQLFDHTRDERNLTALHRGVDCDQRLLPGMCKHWGEVRSCATHPNCRADVRVCKGCRVSHYAQASCAFDRELIMARGARVPVCEGCAAVAIIEQGFRHQSCVCDSHWTCFRCREVVLGQLAEAREKHAKGRCGRCTKAGGLVEHVEFCLYCLTPRTYDATPSEEI